MTEDAPQSRCDEAFVDVSGASVYYLHAGSGRPILFIHGLVGSSQNWRKNIDDFAQHASVYAIDLVNMGKSQRVGGLDPGLLATASRIIAVMDALELADADIVAHSHGGAVALMLAALYPKRVCRLVLFAPANPYCRAGDPIVRTYSTAWGGLLARVLPYFPAPIQRIALGEVYGGSDRVLDSCLHEVVDGLRNRDTLHHVLCILRGWFTERSKLKAALGRVKRIPILLVWGERDCTVSLSSAIKLNRKLKGSELIVLPGGGHAVFEETPEQVNQIVLAWLGSHPLSHPRSRSTVRTVSGTDAIGVPATSDSCCLLTGSELRL